MSFCFSGMGKPVTPGHVTITISDKHPLIQLSNVVAGAKQLLEASQFSREICYLVRHE